MTLDQLDHLLAEWKTIMDTAARNLVELHNLSIYELLFGSTGSPKLKLAGTTEEYLGPAIFAAGEFLREFGILSDTVQRAVELRAQISRFDRFAGLDQKLAEIERILIQRSVGISAGESITPRQLLAQMNLAFRTAYDSLAEVDRVWQQLDAKLAHASGFLNTHAGEPYLGPLRQQIEALRARVIADPLGANADFDREIQPLLTRSQTALEEMIRRRSTVHQDMNAARALLQKLIELRQAAELGYAEYKLKITSHATPTPALPWDRITALAEWLTRLETKLAEGQIDPVCLGLDHWTGHITELIAVEERTCRENQVPLNLRRELRGRLSALKAKACARGVSEDARLSDLAERANALLHARPTPLNDAVALVSQYESRLNGRP